MPNPTLEDVARLAGVSRATVSRVVRGDPLVAPAKVKIVEDAVEELGYVPNRAARALVTNRTDAIAVLVPEPDTRVFSDPFFASAVSGVNRALDPTQLNLLLVMAAPDGSNARLRRFLNYRHADGIVVLSYHEDPDLARQLSRLDVPAVFVGRPPESLSAHYVDIDNVSGGRLATERLIQRGCRKIATITGPHDMASANDRLQGWRDALASTGMRDDLVVEGDFTMGGGGAAAARILEREPDIDGIFAANDLMSLGALRYLERVGKRVPDDIALVGYDDSEMGATASVPLTSVTNPIGEMAMIATKLLIDLIERSSSVAAGYHVLLQPELVARASG